MKTILEYDLVPPPSGSIIELEMYKDSKILHFSYNPSYNLLFPKICVIANTNNQTELRKFIYLDTGDDLPEEKYKHIKTTTVRDNSMGIEQTKHLFEILE